jgi:tetratricopeptide (TPR) repeat protein
MTQLTGAISKSIRKPLKLKLLALASAAALLPATVLADTNAQDGIPRTLGTPAELPFTLSGSYLSGRLAGFQKDFAQAAAFYEETLAADPSNPMLLERTFLLKLANGDVDDAIRYAADLDRGVQRNFLAQLVLGAKDVRDGNYGAAIELLKEGRNGPLAQLIRRYRTRLGLLRLWPDRRSSQDHRQPPRARVVRCLQGNPQGASSVYSRPERSCT